MSDRQRQTTSSSPNSNSKRNTSQASSASTHSPAQHAASSERSSDPVQQSSPPFTESQSLEVVDARGAAASSQKVAIPRLAPVSMSSSNRSGDKKRVSHACESCRARKAKCNGGLPACTRCEEFGIECSYADGKRERAKKESSFNQKRLQEYQDLLRQTTSQVDRSLQDRIYLALSQEEKDSSPDKTSRARSSAATPSSANTSTGGERKVMARVSSLGDLSEAQEDFDNSESARTTGWIGKSSELAWMQGLLIHEDEGLARGLDAPASRAAVESRTAYNVLNQPLGYEDFPASSTSYHEDDATLPTVDQAKQYFLPSYEVAVILINEFFDKLHPSYPILPKEHFCSQVDAFYKQGFRPTDESWFAILNLVFALAARFLYLVGSDAAYTDFSSFAARARTFGRIGEAVLSVPKVENIRYLTLLTLYFLSVNQVNRAWHASAFAIHCCICLGLHLRLSNKQSSEALRESKYRLWWSIYCLNGTVATMLGRPMPVSANEHSTPLPMPFEASPAVVRNQEVEEFMAEYRENPILGSVEELLAVTKISQDSTPIGAQPYARHLPIVCQMYVVADSSICFNHMIMIQLLSSHATSTLYRPGCELKSWDQVEKDIERLNDLLERWRSVLNPAFDFTKSSMDSQSGRYATMLAISHYSVQIIINRPCLCQFTERIGDQSDDSRAFCLQTARTTVRAGIGMLQLLPQNFDTATAYRQSNWWCLTHNIMQSTVVLLCALSTNVTGDEPSQGDVFEYTKLGIRWLRLLATMHTAGRRAWISVANMLRTVAQRRNFSVSDLDLPPQEQQESDVNRLAADQSTVKEIKPKPADITRPGYSAGLFSEAGTLATRRFMHSSQLPASYNDFWPLSVQQSLDQNPTTQQDPMEPPMFSGR